MNEFHMELKLNKDFARIIKRAILPEIDSKEIKRSKTFLFTNKSCLILRIIAEDISSLRAAINTYLRLINMCLLLLHSKE